MYGAAYGYVSFPGGINPQHGINWIGDVFYRPLVNEGEKNINKKQSSVYQISRGAVYVYYWCAHVEANCSNFICLLIKPPLYLRGFYSVLKTIDLLSDLTRFVQLR